MIIVFKINAKLKTQMIQIILTLNLVTIQNKRMEKK